MNTFKTLLFLPLILFSFCSSKSDSGTQTALGNESQKGQVFKVKGRINNFTGKELVLNELTTDGKFSPLDTAAVDASGNFVFQGFVREKTYGIINLGPYRNVFLVIDTTSNMEIDINNSQVITYTVKNSKETEELCKIAQVNADYNQKIIDLDATLQVTPPPGPAKQKEVNDQIEALVAELKVKIAEATAASKSPMAQVFAIEMLQVNLDLKTEEQIISSIDKQPANKWLTGYKNRAQSRLATSVGAKAPEITLNNPEGKALSLSALKGKYVLIDFWASWCKPCRAENPNVVRLYNTYKDKGFEIFGVSLDQNAQAWKNAIAADGLTWQHVSDLGGWQSSAAKLYSVSSIPTTVLLDKEGRIIAKGLRGAELENKLKSLLN